MFIARPYGNNFRGKRSLYYISTLSSGTYFFRSFKTIRLPIHIAIILLQLFHFYLHLAHTRTRTLLKL